MKVHQQGPDVERGGVDNESAFNIKTSAKAFDILSSGLYTNPILAVVRELSCNAYDSHVDAGKIDTPFEIHLPNNLEPWFSVKDFGLGLSDNDVRHVYTTYFESTKTDSNDVIGALGLGSKSPMAYVSSFNVISRYNGQRRNYTAFINENGIPAISQMGDTMETDEPNGVEVSVAVKRGDERKFQRATESALKWFPVKPEVKGVPNFEFEQLPKTKLEGLGWKLLDGSVSYHGEMTAVQGNVAYRVDIQQLELPDVAREALRGNHIVGIFDIGDLEVAASREEIRYDPRSVKALQKCVNTFVQELGNIIEQRVDDATKHLNNSQKWDGFICVVEQIGTLFGRRGKNLDKIFEPDKINNVFLKAFVENKGRVEIGNYYGYNVFLYTNTTFNSKMTRRSYKAGNAIEPNENTFVFYNDVPTGGVSRMYAYKEQQGNPTKYDVVVIAPIKNPEHPVKITNGNSNDDDSDQYHIMRMTEQEIKDEYKKIVNDIGNPPIKVVSTDAPKLKTEKREKKPVCVKQLSRTARTGRTWTPMEVKHDIDITKGGVYIPLRSNRVPNTGTHSHGDDIKMSEERLLTTYSAIITLYNQSKGTHYQPDVVIGAGKAAEKELIKHNWINLFNMLDVVIKDFHSTFVFNAKRKAIERGGRDVGDRFGIVRFLEVQWSSDIRRMFCTKVKALNSKSCFRKEIEPVIKYFEQHIDNVKNVNHIQMVAYKLGAKNKVPNVDDAKSMYDSDNIIDTYPMLKFMTDLGNSINTSGSDQRNVDLQTIFGYINTIDNNY